MELLATYMFSGGMPPATTCRRSCGIMVGDVVDGEEKEELDLAAANDEFDV